jgi:ureidoglycolate lyase
MPRTVRLTVEPMTEEAFSSFGELLDATETSPGHSGSFPVSFEGGKVRVSTALLPYKGLKLTGLEQHFQVTQSFIPISGAPAVVAVAAPTLQGEPNGIPRPQDVRAFLIDGTKGYMLKKGTWHSDRLPLYRPGSKMVIITDEETSQDLLEYGSMTTPVDQRGGWKLNRIVDFQHEFGVTFEVEL